MLAYRQPANNPRLTTVLAELSAAGVEILWLPKPLRDTEGSVAVGSVVALVESERHDEGLLDWLRQEVLPAALRRASSTRGADRKLVEAWGAL